MNASKTHPPERDNDDKRKPDVIPFSNPPRSMRAAVALCGTTPRGKRRMHKTPAQREIDACHYWLEREIETVKPHVLVALGATALKALLEDKSLRCRMRSARRSSMMAAWWWQPGILRMGCVPLMPIPVSASTRTSSTRCDGPAKSRIRRRAASAPEASAYAAVAVCVLTFVGGPSSSKGGLGTKLPITPGSNTRQQVEPPYWK